MSVFRASASAVAQFPRDGSLSRAIFAQMTRGVSPSERKSWDNSLPVLAQDLVDAGLGGVEMLIEFRLPLTSRCADVVLAGTRPGSPDLDAYVVVELKQWSQAETYDAADNLVLVSGMNRPQLHPGTQVEGYCQYMADFLTVLDGRTDQLRGVAYLHNAEEADVRDLLELPQTQYSQLFTKNRRGEFQAFLSRHLAPQSTARAGDRLLSSGVRPSKQLLKLAAEEIKNREQFVLVGNQRLAYELIMNAVEKARSGDRKTAIVVTGGPGSGKSAIALSVLGGVTRQGGAALHATGSKAFTKTLRRYAGKGAPRVKSMFKYFNNFMSAPPNRLDVLICDEAHRIREQSADRWTKAALRTGKPQIDELLSAAYVPVFFLDEHQVVRPGETGTVDVIRSHAEQRGMAVHVIGLHEQFRCGGSSRYERWVLNLLGLPASDTGLDGDEETDAPAESPLRDADMVWATDGQFEVTIAESPHEMEQLLLAKQQEDPGTSARMSAGYCWKWSDPNGDGTLVPDVAIEDWSRPWNVKGESAVGTAPASALWATDPGGFGQVGCVYTAQGFEYDWSGVIIGPDLVARGDQLMSIRNRNVDSVLGHKTSTDAAIDTLIRNTYKVLLTRGMKGTVIYATDPATRDFLRSRVTRGDH
ncbi:DNA/RNA helicase domain-containing protein [Longispora urticae]